ncbi:MAG TPA: response regulator [Gammaproteobacteria bacterium]|nr:response regulator [Gammaproteobacteria bacterium]
MMAASDPSPVSPPGARGPLVVVDDEPLIRHYLQEVLVNAGYAVICMETAREALDFCRATAPAAVLTDLVMPDQDGIEFIRSLRGAGVTAPIIAMSGGGQVQPAVYLDVAVRLGASAALQKPFSNAELLRVVAAQLAAA